MNREEAQFILHAYRASGEDAHDPQFTDALALVRTDPGLAHWFARTQALDAAIQVARDFDAELARESAASQ